jgi:hypothetical protein
VSGRDFIDCGLTCPVFDQVDQHRFTGLIGDAQTRASATSSPPRNEVASRKLRTAFADLLKKHGIPIDLKAHI